MDVKRIKQYSKYMRHREKREGGADRQRETNRQLDRQRQRQIEGEK